MGSQAEIILKVKVYKKAFELLDSIDAEKTEKSIDLSGPEEQQSIRECGIELAINIMDSVDKQWSESALWN